MSYHHPWFQAVLPRYRKKKTAWYCYKKRQIDQSILTEEPEINLKEHFTHQLFLQGLIFPPVAGIPRLFEKMKPDCHYMSLVSGHRDCGLVFSLPSNPLCISPLAELSAGFDLKDPSWSLMATLWKQPNALRVGVDLYSPGIPSKSAVERRVLTGLGWKPREEPGLGGGVSLASGSCPWQGISRRRDKAGEPR